MLSNKTIAFVGIACLSIPLFYWVITSLGKNAQRDQPKQDPEPSPTTTDEVPSAIRAGLENHERNPLNTLEPVEISKTQVKAQIKAEIEAGLKAEIKAVAEAEIKLMLHETFSDRKTEIETLLDSFYESKSESSSMLNEFHVKKTEIERMIVAFDQGNEAVTPLLVDLNNSKAAIYKMLKSVGVKETELNALLDSFKVIQNEIVEQATSARIIADEIRTSESNVKTHEQRAKIKLSECCKMADASQAVVQLNGFAINLLFAMGEQSYNKIAQLRLQYGEWFRRVERCLKMMDDLKQQVEEHPRTSDASTRSELEDRSGQREKMEASEGRDSEQEKEKQENGQERNRKEQNVRKHGKFC